MTFLFAAAFIYLMVVLMVVTGLKRNVSSVPVHVIHTMYLGKYSHIWVNLVVTDGMVPTGIWHL